MSYANYSAATGNAPVHPNHAPVFNIRSNKDRVSDNKQVVRKARILTTKSIRSSQMYATLNLLGSILDVNMPYNGYITITVTGGNLNFGSLAGGLPIYNPYVQANTPVIISDVGAGTVTRQGLQAGITKTPGLISIITTGVLNQGESFSISVGQRNDRIN